MVKPMLFTKEFEDFESGLLSEIEAIVFFASLVKTGKITEMGKDYIEMTGKMIESKIIDSKGNILINLSEIYDG